MPRKPTGKPRGRPAGSGRLTPAQTVIEAQTRLTLRLPRTLYAQLEARAAAHRSLRGTPPLAAYVRALLEHALDCPQRQQAEAQQREAYQRDLEDLLARIRYLEAQGRIARA